MELAVAALVFVGLVTLVVGLWWVAAGRRQVRDRLRDAVQTSHARESQIFRAELRLERSGWAALVSRAPFHARLATLAEAAGSRLAAGDVLLIAGAVAVVAGAAGWVRTGNPLWGACAALLLGPLPVVYLCYQRHRRVARAEQQLPDALDMITRSIRAGYALSGAIQLVGEEAPNPIGAEFRRISEEIRLGMDPALALLGLQRRLPTQDMEFFCTAIRIQRSAGGNLAEILDRLSEVIRERFKLLSHARALSAQHRWAAVCVGLSPVGFAMLFALQSPTYFDPLFASPLATYLIGAGVLMEAIGFFAIWRIAQIKV